MSMGSEKSDDDEESEDDGEEMDGGSVYVSLFAVADRMERWYANGARECPEDHVVRVEALLRRERATNVFETRNDDSVNVGPGRQRHRGRALPAAGGEARGGEGAPARGVAQPGHDRGPAGAGPGDCGAHRTREARPPGAPLGVRRLRLPRLLGLGAPAAARRKSRRTVAFLTRASECCLNGFVATIMFF